MERGCFYVDRLTESIEEVGTGIHRVTEVVRMSANEWRRELKKEGWMFNWRKELRREDREVYKLVIKGNHVIQGLICLKPADGFVDMLLIESATHNLGHGKRYYGVAGNLVAFACKMSLEMGYDGYVGFVAKTRLIPHYEKMLGARLVFRNRMEIGPESARKLVNLYFKGFWNG
jgi:hypothetical protein